MDGANPADRPLNVEGMYCVPVYAGCFDGYKSLVEVKAAIPHTWPHWDDMDAEQRADFADRVNAWLVDRIPQVRGITDVSSKPTNPDRPAVNWHLPSHD